MRKAILASIVGTIVLFITSVCLSGEITLSRNDIDSETSELRPVQQFGKWGFRNEYGMFVIQPEYDQVNKFSEGLAAVKRNGKWGYIDKLGHIAIALQFEEAGSFRHGMARILIHGQNNIINTAGVYIGEVGQLIKEADVIAIGKVGAKKKIGQSKKADFITYEIRIGEVVLGNPDAKAVIYSTASNKKPEYLEPGVGVVMFFKTKKGAAYFVNNLNGLKFFDENGFKPNQFNEDNPIDSVWQNRPVEDFVSYLRTESNKIASK